MNTHNRLMVKVFLAFFLFLIQIGKCKHVRMCIFVHVYMHICTYSNVYAQNIFILLY